MGIVAPVVLLVAAFLLAFRIPAFAQGQGRPVVVAGILAIVAFLLIVPAVYLPIDKLLPGVNTLDPLAKLFLTAAIFVLGDQLAKGLNEQRLVSLISGFRGRLVLLAACVLDILFFLVANGKDSSPMLAVDSGHPVVAVYNAITLAYVSYVSVLLAIGVRRSMGATMLTRRSSGNATVRIDSRGRLLMVVGFALVPVRLALTPLTILVPASFNAVQIVPLAAFALVAVGLFLIRIARRRETNETMPPTFADMVRRLPDDEPGTRN